jgi:hypothetical protein
MKVLLLALVVISWVGTMPGREIAFSMTSRGRSWIGQVERQGDRDGQQRAAATSTPPKRFHRARGGDVKRALAALPKRGTGQGRHP